MKTGRQPVQKVRQADWISTTAKWGVGIVFCVIVVGLFVGQCAP